MPKRDSRGLIAVVDVETTGLFPLRHDRVIEIAAVVVNLDSGIEREFVSLVNPGRDIGPSSIHGLTSADIIAAPPFGNIVSQLLDVCNGTIAIAGHNMRFDRQFLQCEFARIEQSLPDCCSLCTLELAGGRCLEHCCQRFGVEFDGRAHSALHDARAAAKLLLRLLAENPQHINRLSRLEPINWPKVCFATRPPLTREDSRRRRAEPPSYLRRLLGRVHGTAAERHTDGAALAYSALLDRVLEDRYVDETEADALLEMAAQWELDGSAIAAIHRDYLLNLAVAAWEDGVVTDAERRDLELVAQLLGQGEGAVDAALSEAAEMPRTVSDHALKPKENLAGKRVCFTGEFSCTLGGDPISRDHARALSEEAGLEVVASVTKKLDLLVVADPQTQSGKAKKARQYGIRIMHEPVYWQAINADID